MKRWLSIAVGILGVLLGLLFALLNAGAATLDLYFVRLQLPLGVLVLAAVLLGALLAGVVLHIGVVLPLRLRLATLERRQVGGGGAGALR